MLHTSQHTSNPNIQTYVYIQTTHFLPFAHSNHGLLIVIRGGMISIFRSAHPNCIHLLFFFFLFSSSSCSLTIYAIPPHPIPSALFYSVYLYNPSFSLTPTPVFPVIQPSFQTTKPRSPHYHHSNHSFHSSLLPCLLFHLPHS